ncbi:putative Major facilitator superfamily protein [Hibiscus syriacus]|uniref:Major facilitator superfamily protein n=1 Tax=Hibiscus syriacus TaxID=106335 RepID=A0A6A2ZXD8_HIBSY|nr:uncharacterized protein LOC120137650 [Hibiscus syriacus]KAE8696077.1 putative Major facilitator superfamily protein [Hibiscus syriacus]
MHPKLRETLQEIEDDDILKQLIGWFQDLVDGTIGQELETRSLQGLRITHARKGYLRSEFAVPSLAADVNGNWHGGAIAILMDAVGAVAAYSAFHHVIKSVDFSISHYSTAKIQEEVVVEAKVVGNHDKLVQVMMEARMKANNELIASGKMWAALNNFAITTTSSKL